jgi:uncharacterized membrane protein YhaH (DUF805 family)
MNIPINALLSYSGRTDRTVFWTGYGSSVALFAAGTSASAWIAGHVSAELAGAGLAATALLALRIVTAVITTRLHDRGRSGLDYFAAMVMLSALVAGVNNALVASDAITSAHALTNGLCCFVLINAWIMLECGILAGEPDSNSYGARSRQPS